MSRSNRENRGITAATATRARDRSDEKQGLKRHKEELPYMHAEVKPLIKPLPSLEQPDKPKVSF